MTFSIARWDDHFVFSMQGEDIIEHTDDECHMFIF